MKTPTCKTNKTWNETENGKQQKSIITNELSSPLTQKKGKKREGRRRALFSERKIGCTYSFFSCNKGWRQSSFSLMGWIFQQLLLHTVSIVELMVIFIALTILNIMLSFKVIAYIFSANMKLEEASSVGLDSMFECRAA